MRIPYPLPGYRTTAPGTGYSYSTGTVRVPGYRKYNLTETLVQYEVGSTCYSTTVTRPGDPAKRCEEWPRFRF